MLLYVQKKKKNSAMTRPIVILIFLLVVSRLDMSHQSNLAQYPVCEKVF